MISIGDSDFERVGTQNAMENYMRETGIESADGKLVDVNGHMYKVRTKTFKMLDEPTVEDRLWLQFFGLKYLDQEFSGPGLSRAPLQEFFHAMLPLILMFCSAKTTNL